MQIDTSHIKGTEKQLAYANDIITDKLGHVGLNLIGQLMGKSDITEEQFKKLEITSPETGEIYTEKLVNNFVKAQPTDASWWITYQHHLHRLFCEYAVNTFKTL